MNKIKIILIRRIHNIHINNVFFQYIILINNILIKDYKLLDRINKFNVSCYIVFNVQNSQII